MKTILMLLFSINTFASTTYYFATAGNDGNAGTLGSPWQTIAKFNTVFSTKSPGDMFLFNRGDVFVGTLNPNKNGSSGSPFIIGAYGTGPMPVITGLSTISAWTNLGSNIWESTSAVSTLATLNLVVINGVNVPMGRIPNAGSYYTFQSHSATSSITSSSLTGTPNWTGATAVIRSRRSSWDLCPISSQSGGTISISTAETVTPTDGYGFFIENDSRTLDVQNEWYYNSSTKKLQIYSTSSPTNVNVVTVDTLLKVVSSYVTVRDLRFQYANSYAFCGNFAGQTNYTLINDSIEHIGIDGIKLAGMSSFLIDSSSIANCNNNGLNLFFGCPYPTVTNNWLDSTGVYEGMGQSGTEAYTALDVQQHNGYVVNNHVIKSGYSGIKFFGDSAYVQYNVVDTFNTVMDDGGGIYTQSQGATVYHFRKVLNNMVSNGIGNTGGTNSSTYIPAEGIYLDDNTANVEVAYNSVWNCADHGVFWHSASLINMHDNIFYNDSIQFGTQRDGALNAITGCTVTNNIFLARTSTQYDAFFLSSTTDLPGMGTFDNNYYSRPLLETNTITTETCPSGCTTVNRTFGSWQSYSGLDGSSLTSPMTTITIGDIRFEYNSTAFPVTRSLPFNYKGYYGLTYNGTITLAPFSSAPMIKNGAIIQPASNSFIRYYGNCRVR